eukprot:m.211021 g.211021  ORF g.211021 m.211021 type:complete len:334 (-) comp13784_c1_seq6:513-1514(-)
MRLDGVVSFGVGNGVSRGCVQQMIVEGRVCVIDGVVGCDIISESETASGDECPNNCNTHHQQNHSIVTFPQFQVILGLDEVFVEGKKVLQPDHNVVVMNKPLHCLSERVRGMSSWCRSRGIAIGSEEHLNALQKGNPNLRRKIEDGTLSTVYDLLSPDLDHPALGVCGRLDKDTSGLLIMATDGGLQQLLAHPNSHCAKVYTATLDPLKPLDEDVEENFKRGVAIKGGKRHTHCRPALITTLNEETNTVNITIYEGFKHQVKRMVRSCGSRVVKLSRLQFGRLSLADTELGEGEARKMTCDELRLLCAHLNMKARLLLASTQSQVANCSTVFM